MLVVVGLLAFAVLGDPTSTVLGLATNTSNLMMLALGAVALALLWAFVVLGTHVSLRRFTSLTAGQRVMSTALVTAIIAAGGLAAYQTANYSLIGKTTLEAITKNGVQIKGAPRPKNGQADPWAGIPRVNVLLIGSDAGADRIGVRTDSILLASIDTHSGDAVIFGLPRNLQHVPFTPGTPMGSSAPRGTVPRPVVPAQRGVAVRGESAADPSSPAYSYYKKFKNPGLQATVDAVQNVTGLKVDDYLLLDLDGFGFRQRDRRHRHRRQAGRSRSRATRTPPAARWASRATSSPGTSTSTATWRSGTRAPGRTPATTTACSGSAA